jgi:hypothetical protein
MHVKRVLSSYEKVYIYGGSYMEYIVGKSGKDNALEAVSEACKGLSNPKLILFSSEVRRFADLTKEMRNAFPNSLIIGTTTYVGLSGEGVF